MRRRAVPPLGLLLGSLALLIGCADGSRDGATGPGAVPGGAGSDSATAATASPDDRVTAYRVRLEAGRPLNDDGGWAAPINTPATVTVDQPFRLRFEVDAGDGGHARVFALQYRREGGDWRPLPAEDFPYPLKVFEGSPGTIDSPANAGWQVIEGRADFRHLPDPALAIAAGAAPVRAWAETDIEWTPSELSLGVRLPAGATTAFGVLFEDRGDEHYSALELVPPDRVRVSRVDPDGRETLAEAAVAIPTDRWAELTIELSEESGVAALDDEPLIDWPRSGKGTPRLGIELQAGGTVQLKEWTLETDASTPSVSIVSSPAYVHGAATADLLQQSELPFAPGAGLSLKTRTPAWTAQGKHGEWSVPIVVRRFADHAVMTEDGDRFEFRLVDEDDQPLPSAATATVVLDVPAGHLGGTFVETPMRIGPWQSGTGALYFIMEPSETWNRPMMVKSEDVGQSWREVDPAGRPNTGDLEGLATDFADGRIHVLHQITERVLYHVFDTSPGVDAWVIRDEIVAAPPAPPTQVADLVLRSDGSIVAVYGAGDTLQIAVRRADGRWQSETIPAPPGIVLSGPSLALGGNEIVHLAYTRSDGQLRYRQIGTSNELGDSILVADDLGRSEEDVGALLPLATVDGGRTVVALYRTREGHLAERRSSDGTRWRGEPVLTDWRIAQNAVDSDQVGADLAAIGDSLHLLFVDADTGRLFYSAGQDGRWSTPELLVDDARVQWVRGQILRLASGLPVYGLVYDGGSDGGSGRNRFLAVPLQAPPR
jgi:hypothetical protein